VTEMLLRDSGPFTTVQDLGRFGSQSRGVPPAGAADRDALETANLLVGNDRSEACLECTLRGPEFELAGPAAFAVCGADMEVLINGAAVSRWETLYAEDGDVVTIGTALAGLRCYIAFAGGLEVPIILGSRSTYTRAGFGGWEGRALRPGDRIPLRTHPPAHGMPCLAVPEDLRPDYPDEISVRAVPSHETGRFKPDSVQRFYREPYTVSPKSDRMGCRLDGIPLEHTRGADIVSSGVQTGTVQVPGDGRPIVLLADRQTTGGYTRIAHVIQADLSRLGQARPGCRVRFVRATVEEAQAAWRNRERELTARIRLRPQAMMPAEISIPGAPGRRFRVSVGGRTYDVEIAET